MLFPQRFWQSIADGTVTIAFRRWPKTRAVAGSRHRTPLAIIEIDAVDIVSLTDISQDDARAAGYSSVDALVADLRGDDSLPLHRIAFHVSPGDPRAELAETSGLTDGEVAAINERLARFDRAAADAPWTAATLALIAGRPATRATDLAAALGRETLLFKRDVRKLKELGLTLSLGTGYRLSPRGEAYLAARSQGQVVTSPRLPD